jgi:hypothetical protein
LARLRAEQAQYPPGQNGANNDAQRPGLVFTVPPVDDMADFHGSLDDLALVLYCQAIISSPWRAWRARLVLGRSIHPLLSPGHSLYPQW